MVLFALDDPACVGVTPAAAPRPAVVPQGPQVSVIDVAAGVALVTLPGLVRLGPDERVVAAADQPLPGDAFEAGALISTLAPLPGRYLDLTVSGPAGERRVLVLLH